MGVIPGLLAMLAGAGALWWSWFYPARIVGPSWYGSFASRIFLYLIPPFALLLIWVGIGETAQGLGWPLPEGIADAGSVLLFLLLVAGILGTLGVPLPAPWAPARMRERRKRQRAERRDRKVHR